MCLHVSQCVCVCVCVLCVYMTDPSPPRRWKIRQPLYAHTHTNACNHTKHLRHIFNFDRYNLNSTSINILQADENGHSQTPDDASPSTGSNIVETSAMADKALASAKLEFDLLTSQRDATFVVGIFLGLHVCV